MYSEKETEEEILHISLNREHFNLRLDQALAKILPEYSRSKLQQWLEQGNVKVDGETVTVAREKVTGLEDIEIKVINEIQVLSKPEKIDLNIVYEDNDIIIINKPYDLVVHPGAGNHTGTLLNGLLYHYPDLKDVPRAGIVHRLDKDTTGLMVVAKNIQAQNILVKNLQKRLITREYEAVAFGVMTKGGLVNEPIGRDPNKRTAMAVNDNGKPAITKYRVMESFRNYTRLRLRLETGRTHQIRVHMSHIGHPLLGDTLYGGTIRIPKKASEKLITSMRNFKRQALHAVRLKLEQPITGEELDFVSDIPEDMLDLINLLRDDSLINKVEEY